MRTHFKPTNQPAAFRAGMFHSFFSDPLRNTDFFHAGRIGNDIGMIANTVDHRFCAELTQFITGKFRARIAPGNMMPCRTIIEAMLRTVFAATTHEV